MDLHKKLADLDLKSRLTWLISQVLADLISLLQNSDIHKGLASFSCRSIHTDRITPDQL